MAYISKLEGHPVTDVSDWLYEKEEIKKKDPGLPLRPNNQRKDKKTNMPANKLATTLGRVVIAVNKIIDEINKIPELKLQVAALDAKVSLVEAEVATIKSTMALKSELTEHAAKMSPAAGGHTSGGSGGGTGGGTTGGRRGGQFRKLQSGGKTRTSPKPTSREDFKQMLINDILQLQNNGG